MRTIPSSLMMAAAGTAATSAAAWRGGHGSASAFFKHAESACDQAPDRFSRVRVHRQSRIVHALPNLELEARFSQGFVNVSGHNCRQQIQHAAAKSKGRTHKDALRVMQGPGICDWNALRFRDRKKRNKHKKNLLDSFLFSKSQQ